MEEERGGAKERGKERESESVDRKSSRRSAAARSRLPRVSYQSRPRCSSSCGLDWIKALLPLSFRQRESKERFRERERTKGGLSPFFAAAANRERRAFRSTSTSSLSLTLFPFPLLLPFPQASTATPSATSSRSTSSRARSTRTSSPRRTTATCRTCPAR